MKIKPISIALLFAGSAYAVDNPFSSLTALGNNLAAGDLLVVTDVSDTTQSANGTTKKILASDVGLFYISDTAYNRGTWDADLTHAASKNALSDYFHLFDTDDDGKVNLLDNIAAAGFPYTDSTGLVLGSRVLAAGAGISITNADGSAGNPTYALDPTTLTGNRTFGNGTDATIVWTWNLTGTDPVLTIGSGLFNFSTGSVQVGGANVDTVSGTATLTNKRITARTGTTASSATPAINTDNVDMYTITALATAITSMTSSLTGTPVLGDQLLIRIKDDGTTRAITWGASFASRGATLPTATTATKTMYVLLIWNSTTSTWDCISTATEA